jgi:hypothetical protein
MIFIPPIVGKLLIQKKRDKNKKRNSKAEPKDIKYGIEFLLGDASYRSLYVVSYHLICGCFKSCLLHKMH